jgi:hypothetical protein
MQASQQPSPGKPLTGPISSHLPSTDFLSHLQERLGLDEPAAAQRLQHWLHSYEPGPAALARAVGREGDAISDAA